MDMKTLYFKKVNQKRELEAKNTEMFNMIYDEAQFLFGREAINAMENERTEILNQMNKLRTELAEMRKDHFTREELREMRKEYNPNWDGVKRPSLIEGGK